MSEALNESEAAACAHVNVETIRKWVGRGLLKPIRDRDGRRLFREFDVLAAEQRTRRGARRRLLIEKASTLLDNDPEDCPK